MGLLKIFLAIGIAVLLAVFVGYGLHVFYPEPDYGYVDTTSCIDQFNCQNLVAHCDNQTLVNVSDSQVKAIPVGYNSGCYDKVYASAAYQKCSKDQQLCFEKLNQSSENYFHARNSFYILTLLAIIAIFSGVRLWNKEGVGSGFVGGGVLIVLYSLGATEAYWTTLNKYFRLIAIGIVLVLLIWLAYKKIDQSISDNKNKKKSKGR